MTQVTPDATIDKLKLPSKLELKLRKANINTVAELTSARQNGTLLTTKGLSESDLQIIENAIHHTPEQPAWASPQLISFYAAVAILAITTITLIWGFTKDSLAPHQYWIMTAVVPITTGLAFGAITGSLTIRPSTLLYGIVATATGGGAAWLLSFLLLHHFIPTTEPTVESQLIITENGIAVQAAFELSYRHDGVQKALKGEGGRATLTIKGHNATIEPLSIEAPCYTLASSQPISVISGKDTQIPLRRIQSKQPEPLLPGQYPDVKSIIPKKSIPSDDALRQETSSEERSSHTVEIRNEAAVPLRVLLYNFWRSNAGEEPWRSIYCDPCAEPCNLSNFHEPNGRFAIIAMNEDGSGTSFIGIYDVYAQPRLTVCINKKGHGYVSCNSH